MKLFPVVAIVIVIGVIGAVAYFSNAFTGRATEEFQNAEGTPPSTTSMSKDEAIQIADASVYGELFTDMETLYNKIISCEDIIVDELYEATQQITNPPDKQTVEEIWKQGLGCEMEFGKEAVQNNDGSFTVTYIQRSVPSCENKLDLSCDVVVDPVTRQADSDCYGGDIVTVAYMTNLFLETRNCQEFAELYVSFLMGMGPGDMPPIEKWG